MLEQSHFYPSHIKDLLSELETSEYGDSVLLKYHMKTISDPTLLNVYSLLDYPNIQEIKSAQVIEAILQEYLKEFHKIDTDLEGPKIGFAGVFYENHLNFLSDPNELGLEIQKQEIFEGTSLNSLWSEETSSSPIKTPLSIKAPKTTLRSKNGLKVLSWKVKDIVERLGSSTYQEVADILVKDTEEVEGDTKDEKNIRRRVYDALNVLIAVGVLQKNGKKVEPLKKNESPTVEKLKKLKEISERFLVIKGVIEKNKMHQKKNFQALQLPFKLISIGKKGDRNVNVLTNLQNNKRISIRVDQEFNIQDSEELLRKVKVEVNYSWLPFQLNSLFNTHLYDNSILF